MAVELTPISSKATLPTAINTINEIVRSLAAEAQTKTINQSGSSAMVNGKLSTGTYGQVIYDTNGIPRIYIGQKPSNGEPIIAITKHGKNVIDALGGSMS